MKADRALATVLFTDIIGSTERAAELEDRAWRDLLQKHHALVRRELRRYGGREVNTAGDGFVATFDGPADAILCACSIRDAVREIGLEIRSGLHMGEVERAEGTIGGIAVHIGARVAARAQASEVLVSSTVRDAEAGSGFGFEDRGLHDLKGVPGQWRLFAVTRLPEREAKSPRGRWDGRVPFRAVRVGLAAALAALLALAAFYFLARDRTGGLDPEEALAKDAAPGIAVLPFTVHGSGLDVWREGMVDVLSTNLDGAAGLRAIDSRTVLARWRESVEGEELPDLATALEVARRTGARYALLGDAVAAGPGVRFSARVYETRSGAKLGEGQVEGSPDSIFKLVDRFSIEILRAVLQRSESEIPVFDLARVTTSSPAALKDFLEGEAFYRRSDFERAIHAYRRAIGADSTFALALYRLGSALGWTEAGGEDDYLERAARLADQLPAREAFRVRLGSAQQASLDSMRQAVERYPEDAEMWYELGDGYFHNGPGHLVGQRETEAAFSRAVQLDPSFTPAYIHLIQMVVGHADSARAATLIETYGRLAPGTRYDQTHRIVFPLLFGDAADRDRARVALDTLPSFALGEVYAYLGHPRFRAAMEEVSDAILERADSDEFGIVRRFWVYLGSGKLREAVAGLDDPRLPASLIAGSLLIGHYAGMPVPSERLDRELSRSPPESTLTTQTFRAGLYAAERGRWADHDSALARVREHARSSYAANDSAQARQAQAMEKGLRGYALWKRGRLEEAARLLREAQRESDFDRNLNRHLRWFLGQLLLETGRPEEAVPYFESFWPGAFSLNEFPLSYFYLGRAYEQMQEYEKARQSYELFAMAWKDADPELQPMVAEARAAARRLTGAIRE
jgi:class 3 adenylate cyclase/tetratricopeptide (TPR) repeat protein